MGKHSRSHQPQLLERLRPVDYIKRPDVISGAPDITRPRDIYSFLSLGYISTDLKTSISSQKRRAAAGGAPLNHNSHHYNNPLQQIATGSVSSSSHPEWDQSNSSSYIIFDTLNTHSKLPAIQAENIQEDDEEIFFAEDEEGPTEGGLTPRKSLINEEDHRIQITQTYIFAPPDRLQETVKYNKNVILPKIKPKKTPFGETTQKEDETNPVLAPFAAAATDSIIPTTNKPKHVKINPNHTDISPRAAEMNSNNYLFGSRPECLFMNQRLGDRNPLLRTHKESPTLSVPKASPGLHDLKDYDEYPDVYWQLRDSTITQPEDLEADMIDRDLYRLRQISNLKLNSIEKTFQVHQDPFRRWRWKAGDPVFSPRQQQRPLNRSFREKKLKDIPIYPQALPRPKLRVSVSQLKPSVAEFREVLTPRNNIMDPRRAQEKDDVMPMDEQKNDYHVSRVDTPFEEIPALPAFDTPRDSLPGNTPRDVVAASMESVRRMDEIMAEGDQFGKIPVQKMHQLKGMQNKLPVKTALVQVDLKPLETYIKEHRSSGTKPICKNNSRGVGHSHKLESFREQLHGATDNDEHIGSKINTSRSEKHHHQHNLNDDVAAALVEADTANNDISGNPEDANNPNNKKVPAPVSTLLLQPDLSRLSLYPPGDVIDNWDAETGTLTSAAAMLNRGGLTSPVVSDSSGAIKERRRNGSHNPMKPVRLEVFSERFGVVGGGVAGGNAGAGAGGGGGGGAPGDNSVIKIPTGRISYLKDMPSYKLDLVNYPPSNARQSCQRSSSAGFSDGRRTHFTNATNNPLTPRSRHTHVKSSVGGASGGDQPGDNSKNIPPKTGDTNISIRFGQQGQVIVSSSREGRQSR